MAMYISSSRRRQREFTDELQNSYLHLMKVEAAEGAKTFTLKWFINNMFELMQGVNYTSHYIRFDETVHRLRIMRCVTKLTSETTDRKLNYLLLGLTPGLGEHADVSFSILGPSDIEIKPDKCYSRLVSNLPDRKCYVEFVECPNLTSLYLTVLCRITVKSETKAVVVEKRNSLVPDLKNLLESEEYSDVTVEVDGREFHVHRAILASRSPVFRAMFQNDMKEKSEQRLVIQDCDSNAFHELVQYMYTGRTCPLTTQLAQDLLSLADKYNVQDLLQELEEYLLLNIRIENVASTLFMADRHNVKSLKWGAISFIGEHLGRVMNSQDWVRLRGRADLMEEILKYFV